MKKKILKILWNIKIILYKNVDINRKKYERNGIETIVNSDGILWLNEKHIEERLDHKHLLEITTKYNSNHRKHRYGLVEEPKKQVNRVFINKQLAVKVIMDRRQV